MRISNHQIGLVPVLNPSKPSQTRPIKLMCLLAFCLSGSILAQATKAHGLKEKNVKKSFASLAHGCQSFEGPSTAITIFSRTWQQLQDSNGLNPYVNFINNAFLPPCNGRYQEFSPRFASFVDTGSFMLSEDAGQMGCRIDREFKKVFSCKEKFLEADEILVAAKAADKEFKPSKEYYQSLGDSLDFQPLNGNKVEYQAHQKAIAYVQQEMLQTPDFFQKSEEEILVFIKEIHQLLAQNQKGSNPGKYRNKAIIVNTFGSDFNAMRDFLIKEYKPLDPAELKAFNAEVKIFDESMITYKEMSLPAAVKHFSKDQERVWKKIIGIPPHAEFVTAGMQELVKKFKNYHIQQIHPLGIAAWLHCALVEIHPFEDGNGRTARLLMNAYLAFMGYQPVAFPDKLMYAKAVKANTESPGFFAKYLVSVINWNKRNIRNIR